MKRVDPIFSIFCAISLAAGTSCITINNPGSNGAPQPTKTRTQKPSTPGTVNGKSISAEMTDEQILAAFNVDIKAATSEVARGPDGYTTSHKLNDQMVSITRSVVTGVYVYASGPIKGDWRLGGGN